MSQEKLEWYRSHLPEVDDAELTAILADPNTVWYDVDSMPPAYQFFRDTRLRGVHSPAYNISGGADRFGRGNANREFPWFKPGGTRQGDGTNSAKFVRLPRQPDSDKPWPVVWFEDRRDRHVDWVFPVGTTFGEIIYIRDTDNDEWIAFEIRTRTREIDDWGVDIFRPFPHQASLVARLAKEGKVDLAEQVTAAKPEQLTVSSGRLNNAFRETATVQTLPEFPKDLTRTLLATTKFTSALGDEWAADIDGPTTQQTFSIVPKNFTGAHLGNDRTTGCKNCHQDVLARARDFNAPREWYGRVRGADRIFSFHPFARSSISTNGSSRTIRFNRQLTESGMVAKYDRPEHPNTVYMQLSRSR